VTKGGVDRLLRRADAPLARRRIAALVRNGLPPALARPLESLFGVELTPAETEAVAAAERVRAEVEAGEGSTVLAPHRGEEHRIERRPDELARVSSIPQVWGLVLHLLAAETAAERILELGSCAGVSGAYLASAPTCERFAGIEGSAELAARARLAVQGVRPAAEILDGLFEERLDDAVAALDGRVDLAFLDGERRRHALPALLDRIAAVARPGAVLVVDDIRFARATWGAWREVSGRRWCAHAVDLGRMGLLVVGDGPGRPRSLAPLTGLWIVRNR
jgi:predicted O-methyltransferase YrrM